MEFPASFIYQSELPFERDTVQCRDGKWVFVRYRRAPEEVLARADTREEIWRMARRVTDGPVWEEHYEGMQMVDCIPPKGVFRHPQTCFIVTDGSPRPSKPAPEPESHVRLKAAPEAAPETPRSLNWPEERTDWKSRVKEAVVKKIRRL